MNGAKNVPSSQRRQVAYVVRREFTPDPAAMLDAAARLLNSETADAHAADQEGELSTLQAKEALDRTFPSTPEQNQPEVAP